MPEGNCCLSSAGNVSQSFTIRHILHQEFWHFIIILLNSKTKIKVKINAAMLMDSAQTEITDFKELYNGHRYDL